MNFPLSAVLRRSAPLWACAVLAACASLRSPSSLPPGTSIAEVRQSFGAGDEYALPGGGTRVAFRRGRDTYMLDFDPSGRLVHTDQVLTLPSFAQIQPGMSKTDVLTRLGQPAFVFPIGYQQLQVWNYRFGGLEGDCMVFQISFSNATGAVTEAGQGPDPQCSRDSAHD